MFNIKKIYEPKTLKEALKIYASNPGLKIIAGGTDVLIQLRHGKFEDIELLSIKNIEELNIISIKDDGAIAIGALTTFSTIFRNEIINKYIPILVEASVSMGGPQIRNAATIGGNICNGAVSADSAPSLFVLDALLKLEKENTERLVPITSFYEGPGKVKLQPGEILTEIIIRKENYQDRFAKYIKFSNRKAMDIAMISVAVLEKIEKNKFKDLKIALGVSAPTPLRCFKAEKYAVDKEVNEEVIKEIAELTLEDAKPRDSWRGSKIYRKHLIKVLTERALKEVNNMVGGNTNE